MNQQVTQKPSAIKALIEAPNFAASIAMRIGNEVYAKKFVKMFQTAINKVPNLLKCTPASITLAAYHLAELNLSPIPQHGHAYLIPYKNKDGVYECQFQLGWRGLTTMAIRDGGVRSVTSEVVYKGDTMICTQGLEPKLIHELNMECERNDKNIYAVYAVAHLADGSKIFEIMSAPQIEAHKKQYSQAVRGGRSSPWDSAYGEMARKTVVKRLSKYLLMCESLSHAIDVDNTASGFEERDITDQVEIVEEIKQRVAKNVAKRNSTPSPVDMSHYEEQETERPAMDMEKGTFSTGDYQTDVLRAVDVGLNEGLISQKAVDVFCSDRNVPGVSNLKKEDALLLINDIERKYANVYKE